MPVGKFLQGFPQIGIGCYAAGDNEVFAVGVGCFKITDGFFQFYGQTFCGSFLEASAYICRVFIIENGVFQFSVRRI